MGFSSENCGATPRNLENIDRSNDEWRAELSSRTQTVSERRGYADVREFAGNVPGTFDSAGQTAIRQGANDLLDSCCPASLLKLQRWRGRLTSRYHGVRDRFLDSLSVG